MIAEIFDKVCTPNFEGSFHHFNIDDCRQKETRVKYRFENCAKSKSVSDTSSNFSQSQVR